MSEDEGENQYFTETSTKVRDLEEKQRIIKDRILLIGQNLIEMKEDVHIAFLDIKKDIEIGKKLDFIAQELNREIEQVALLYKDVAEEIGREQGKKSEYQKELQHYR